MHFVTEVRIMNIRFKDYTCASRGRLGAALQPMCKFVLTERYSKEDLKGTPDRKGPLTFCYNRHYAGSGATRCKCAFPQAS